MTTAGCLNGDPTVAKWGVFVQSMGLPVDLHSNLKKWQNWLLIAASWQNSICPTCVHSHIWRVCSPE